MERKTVELHNPAVSLPDTSGTRFTEELTPQQCDECRAKKLKCSRTRPTCSFCTRDRKSCVYSAKKQRAPLTRAYVSGLERRILDLERLLRAKDPDVNIDDAVPRDNDLSQNELSSVFSNGSISEPTPNNNEEQPEDSPPESLQVPKGSRGFDWATDNDCTPTGDGRPAVPDGGGYRGKFTNIALLRTLHKFGSLWRNAPIRQPDGLAHLQVNGEFTNVIPLESLESPDATEGYADFLIDAYFLNFHTTYPILHEATFRAQHSDVVPRPHHGAWLLLSRAVFAIGAWCSGCRISVGENDDPIDCLQIFDNIDFFRRGCLYMVQGLTLIACYTHKQNKCNTSSIYLGAAVKMAMSIGLHREFPEWEISLLDREMRRRVWWCLYILESGQSMAVGRPILLPCPDSMDIKRPLNIPEQLLTKRSETQPKELSGLTIYSNLIAQAEFHLMVNNTYNLCIDSTNLRATDLLALNAKIDSWMAQLPVYLREDPAFPLTNPRLGFAPFHLSWRVRCLKISFFFPFLVQMASTQGGEARLDRSASAWQDAVRVCLDYAHYIIASIETFYTKEHASPLRDWYARYCLIQGALVLILIIHSNFDFLQEYKPTLTSDLDKTTSLLARVLNQEQLPQMILDIMAQLRTSSAQDGISETATTLLDETVGDTFSYAPYFNDAADPTLWTIWNEPM